MSETSRRVRTAVPGAILFVTLITVGGTIGTTLCTAVLAGFMCYELSRVIYSLSDRKEKISALMGTAWLILFLNMVLPKAMLEALVLGFIGMFTYYLAIADRHAKDLRKHFEELVYTTFVLLYVVIFIAFLPLIRQSPNGLKWTLVFFLIVWAGDIGAYFVGRKYGKIKLYPIISPGKTLQGAAGGLGASVVICFLFKLLFFRALPWSGVFIIPIVVGVFSQIGDLCESLLKRAYDLKDSGKILPGHGGMLDRFDGVLFSLPLMYFCVRLFS